MPWWCSTVVRHAASGRRRPLDALAAFDVSPVTLGDRVAHRRAFQAGRTALELEPRSLAAAETVALYRSTLEAGK